MNENLTAKQLWLPGRRWDPLWIFLLCAFCFCWSLGSAPLAGTEGFRALTATQMLDSGDWLIPRLYGQLYLRKPPMMYWMLATAEMIAGTANEWVWRLPSALGAAALGAFFAWRSRKWWGRVAGLATGVSFLALGALWSQFRSADIDVLNTIFAWLAVLSLFEIYHRGGRWKWMLAGAVGLGGALLLKGPAALPLVLGALIAPPLLSGRTGELRKGYVWGLLLTGALLFGAYMLTVMNALDTLANPAATSGLREAGDKMTVSSWGELGTALLLPLELLLYALPVLVAAVLLLRRQVLSVLENDTAMMLRSLAGTYVIAAAVGVVSGMRNPRYGYILLPIFALLAGLYAATVANGKTDKREQRIAHIALLSVTLLLGLAAVGMAVRIVSETGEYLALGLALPAALAFAGAVQAWRKARAGLLYCACVLALVSVALGFDHIKNGERWERSGYRAGIEMADITGKDARVMTGLMLWTHPEIFHYAEVEVDARNRWQFAEPFELGKSGWVLFHRREWERWNRRWPGRFSRVKELPTHVRGAMLAWYSDPEPQSNAKASDR